MARISRRFPTLAVLLKEGNRLVGAVAEEGDDLRDLQVWQERLAQNLARLQDASVQVAALQAQKQTLVQEMLGLQEDSARLMSVLHLGVKNHYGTRSEKLVKFGLQPFRRRKKSSRLPDNSEGAPESSGLSEG